MSRGLMYWIIVLIWVLTILAPMFGFNSPTMHNVSEAVLLILFVLLGWQVYGPPIHG